jgi:hypothetical protein
MCFVYYTGKLCVLYTGNCAIRVILYWLLNNILIIILANYVFCILCWQAMCFVYWQCPPALGQAGSLEGHCGQTPGNQAMGLSRSTLTVTVTANWRPPPSGLTCAPSTGRRGSQTYKRANCVRQPCLHPIAWCIWCNYVDRVDDKALLFRNIIININNGLIWCFIVLRWC